MECTGAQETAEENAVECSAGTDTYPNDSHIINYNILVEWRVRRNRTEPVWMKDYER